MPPSAAIAIGIVSLGCAKNLVDTEYMGARLREAGYRFTDDPAAADVLMVNTCAFIHDARRESIDAVLEAAAMKQQGACRFLIVTGCLAQRYTPDLKTSMPEVDAFLGVDQLDAIVPLLDAWRTRRRYPLTAPAAQEPPRRLFEPPPDRRPLTGGPYAYVKISEGCNHRCAFCAIPAIRGRARSRTIPAIRAETEALLAAGIRELNLVAQDSTAYGRDLRNGTTLATLLRELGGIGGDFWIRLLYGYPSRRTDALWRTMAAIPRVCRYLDIPVQHSHPDMLKRMRRAQTVDAVRDLAVRARSIMPGVVLRTTCLVGHPGESEAAFEHLRAYLDAARFDHLGVFVFSPEDGTPAAQSTPRVPVAVARRRRAQLMREQQHRVARQLKKRVGQTDRILVEQVGDDNGKRAVGRSQGQAPDVDGTVRIRASGARLMPGQFVDVRYQAVRTYDLTAIAL